MPLEYIIIIIVALIVLAVYTACVFHFLGKIGRTDLAAALIMIPVGLVMGASIGTSSIQWLRTSAVLGVLLASYSSCYVAVQVFGSPQQQRFRKQLTPFVGVAGLLVLFLDYLRGSNGGSFIAGQPYTPDAVYYICYIVGHSLMAFLIGCGLPSLLYSIRNAESLEYRLRLWFTTAASAFATISPLYVSMYAATLLLTNASPMSMLNALQNLLVLAMLLFLLLSILPRGFFRLLLSPYRWVQQRQAEQVERSLTWLHQQVTAIVPWIRLSGYRSELRLLVEISDARRVILSHLPNAAAAPLAPTEEAAYLAQLVKQGQIIDKAGPHTPLPPNTEVRTHHLAVAQHLAQQIRQ